MPLIPLTITATSGDKTYGDTRTFAGTEFSTSGLMAGDSVSSVSLSSSGAAATAQIGEYAITPSSAVGVGLDKYEITYVDGSLTVVKAPLTIKALDSTKEYGLSGEPRPPRWREVVVSGLVNDDSVLDVQLACEGYEQSAQVSGSPYEISPSDAEGTGLDNYEITYETGLLNVTPAPLSVIPRDVTKNFGLTYVFGSNDVDVSSDSLYGDDGFTQIVLFSEGAAAEAEPNRYYPIYVQAVDGVGLSNYEITFGTGNMFVADGKYGGTPMCGESGRPVDGLNAPVCATELHYLSFVLIHSDLYGGSVEIELYRDPAGYWDDPWVSGRTIKLDIPEDMAEFAVGGGYRFLVYVRLREEHSDGASVHGVKVRATLRSSVTEFTVEKSIYINEHMGEPTSILEYFGYFTVNSTFNGLTYSEAYID